MTRRGDYNPHRDLEPGCYWRDCAGRLWYKPLEAAGKPPGHVDAIVVEGPGSPAQYELPLNPAAGRGKPTG